ncbi:MAG: ABC transporter permease [Ignavibacteriae bacterium]|nr:ABC transporter permease [Ignavibacteriota bacterium]
MLKLRMIQSGFRTAWTHKVRAIFMILSVMIGIAAMTIVLSLGKGTEQKILSQVQKFFSARTIMLVSGGGRMEPNRPVSFAGNLKLHDVEEVAQQLADITEWDAILPVPGKEAQASGNSTPVDIVGHTPSAEVVHNFVMVQGRFFSETENRALARVAVITPHVRERLFGATDPIGQMIRIDNVPFQIIGLIGPRGMDPHGTDKDNEVLIPLNTVLRRVANVDYVMLAKFQTSNEQRLNETAERIRSIVRERHSIHQNEEDDFMIITPVRVNELIGNATRIFNLYLPLVAFVSLLVGAIVVVNLMLISVSERVKEIGLRKAVGATSRDIALQLLIEASSITIVSGLAGIVVGVLLLTQIVKLMSLPFTVSWSAVILCFIISALVGIAAGYVPARKAAGLTPVESLR